MLQILIVSFEPNRTLEHLLFWQKESNGKTDFLIKNKNPNRNLIFLKTRTVSNTDAHILMSHHYRTRRILKTVNYILYNHSTPLRCT